MGKKANFSDVLAISAEFQSDVLGNTPASRLVEKYNCGYTTVKEAARRVRFLKENGYLEKQRTFRQELASASFDPPVEYTPDDPRVVELEKENSLLRLQLTWAERADPGNRQGGTITINHSDDHYGDRAHMLGCHSEMVEKTFILLGMYKPDKIIWFSNGDKVAGRGIYKEQHMDSVLNNTRDQRAVAVAKEVEIYERMVNELPEAEIQFRYTHGNHDVNMGERITPDFVYNLRAFGVPAVYHGDEAIINLADNGTYNAYFEHGTGYSEISPSSPKWWNNMRDKLLRLSRRFYSDDRIRRVSHGHTHWFSLGMERTLDVFIDTTGGCQRNERVLLGKNNRPMGWIAYISPEGYDSILDPVPIQPQVETVERELADPYLFNKNLDDASRYLTIYREMALGRGIIADQIDIPEGR